MLAVLLIGVYSALLLAIYGAGFLALAARVLRLNPTEKPAFIQASLAGFVPLVWLTSLISIFRPVDQSVAIGLFIGAVATGGWLFLRRRDWLTGWWNDLKNLHPAVWITAAVALVTTLVLATLKPGNSDTGLYHAQAIRWIESYAAVPGLGNLHSRFAYNSNWFPLQAGFSFAFLDLRSFHLMGAVLTALCLAWFAGGLQDLLTRGHTFSRWARFAFLPLTFYVLASEVSSTGTDLPVTLLTWAILCVWIETLETPSEGLDWRHLLLITLPTLLVSIKLSAFPLMLVIAWVLLPRLRKAGGWRAAWMAAAFTLLLWAPWLARNVILSGYIAYPQAAIDVFNVPWKMPLKGVKDEADWIVSWARFPRMDKEQVLAMPVTQWAPMWFDDLTKNRQIILFIMAAAPFGFGLAALAAFSFFRKQFRGWFQPLALTLPAWIVTYAGILFWFFSVPRYRFGNGVLMAGLVLIVLCGIGLFRQILKPLARYAPLTAALLAVAYLSVVLFQSAEPKTLNARLLLPADYVNLPTEPCNFGDFGVSCATQYQQCGYNPFPCVPQSFPYVFLRGKSFGDGFEVK